MVRTRFPSCHLYSDPTISRHLLYRGISISRELSSTAPPSDYLRSRQMSSSHFQQQLCKISRILVSKFITLQKSCRKRFFFFFLHKLVTTLPVKCPLGTSNIRYFYFLHTVICRLDVRDHVPLVGHVISLYGNSDIHILGEPRDTEVAFGTWA